MIKTFLLNHNIKTYSVKTLVRIPVSLNRVHRFTYSSNSTRTVPTLEEDVERLSRAITLLIRSGHSDQAKSLLNQIKSRYNLLDDLHREEVLRGKPSGILFALQIACMREQENKILANETVRLTTHGMQLDLVLKRCKDPQFLSACATTFRDIELVEYAKRLFAILVDRNPTDYTFLYNLAHIHEQMGHYNTALQHYETILKHHSDTYTVISARVSHCLERVGAFKEAAESYQTHIKTELDTVNSILSTDNIARNIKDHFHLKDGRLIDSIKLDKIVKGMLHLGYLHTMDERFDKTDIVYESLALILTGFVTSFGELEEMKLVTGKFVIHAVSVIYDWTTCLRKQLMLDRNAEINSKKLQSIEGILGLVESLLPSVNEASHQSLVLATLCRLHIERLKAVNEGRSEPTLEKEWKRLTLAYMYTRTEEQVKLVIWEVINVLLKTGNNDKEYLDQLMRWIARHEPIYANNAMLWQQLRRLQNRRVHDPSSKESIVMLDIMVIFKNKENINMCRKYRVVEQSIEQAQQAVIDFESLENHDAAIMAIEKHSWKDTMELILDMQREQQKLLGSSSLGDRYIFTGIIQSSVSAPI